MRQIAVLPAYEKTVNEIYEQANLRDGEVILLAMEKGDRVPLSRDYRESTLKDAVDHILENSSSDTLRNNRFVHHLEVAPESLGNRFAQHYGIPEPTTRGPTLG